MSFYAKLHGAALELSKILTFEGDEGERGYGIKYSNEIKSNYPWVYIDFDFHGSVPLEVFTKVENTFKQICAESVHLASYLTTSISTKSFRCRLIYREDILK